MHISALALKLLDLDQVWWLVSPQNPLKPIDGMAPFPVRLEGARRIAEADRRILVTDLESRLHSRPWDVSRPRLSANISEEP